MAWATFDAGANCHSVRVDISVNFGWYQYFELIDTTPGFGYQTAAYMGMPGDVVEFLLTPFTGAGGGGVPGAPVSTGAIYL